MIQPRLEVARRRLHDDRRLEAFRLHPLESRGVEVINQAQCVFALRANVDVPSLAVLVFEPANGLQQRRLIPRPRQHFGLVRLSIDGRFVEADLENIDRHGVGLAGDCV